MKICSAFLKGLSKNLHLSLYYLDLYFTINPDDLQIIFDICKQIKLDKLLIRNYNMYNLDDLDVTLNIIKDFINENNNLAFLAYNIEGIAATDISDIHYKSCKNLENFVKNTQSFVKMVEYNDLVVKVSDTDGSLMNS